MNEDAYQLALAQLLQSGRQEPVAPVMSQMAPMQMPQYQGPVGGGGESEDAGLAGILGAIGGAAGGIGQAGYAAGQSPQSPAGGGLPAQYNEPSQYPVTSTSGTTFPWAGNLGSAPATAPATAPQNPSLGSEVNINVPATDPNVSNGILNPKTAYGMSGEDMAGLYLSGPQQDIPGTLGNLSKPPEMRPIGGTFKVGQDGGMTPEKHLYGNSATLYGTGGKPMSSAQSGVSPTSPSGASAVQLPQIMALANAPSPKSASAPTLDINSKTGSLANAAGLGGIGVSPGQENEWLASAVAGGVGQGLTGQGGLGRVALGGVGNMPLNAGGGLVGNLVPYALSYYARDKFA